MDEGTWEAEDDEGANQIEPPASFVALFLTRAGDRLTQSPAVVRRRYDLCEDLAQTLSEQAATTLFKSAGSEASVLDQLLEALAAPESVVSPAEAQWVVRRVCEVLGWEWQGPVGLAAGSM